MNNEKNQKKLFLCHSFLGKFAVLYLLILVHSLEGGGGGWLRFDIYGGPQLSYVYKKVLHLKSIFLQTKRFLIKKVKVTKKKKREREKRILHINKTRGKISRQIHAANCHGKMKTWYTSLKLSHLVKVTKKNKISSPLQKMYEEAANSVASSKNI